MLEPLAGSAATGQARERTDAAVSGDLALESS